MISALVRGNGSDCSEEYRAYNQGDTVQWTWENICISSYSRSRIMFKVISDYAYSTLFEHIHRENLHKYAKAVKG